MLKKFEEYKVFSDAKASLKTNRKILAHSVIYEYEDDYTDTVNSETNDVLYKFYYNHDEQFMYVVHPNGCNTGINLSGHIRKNGKISSVVELAKEFEEILIEDLYECMEKFNK